jgi:hypothetical protein
MISARTKAALAAAKARGVKLGCPHPERGAALGAAAQKASADRFAANVRPIIDKIRAAGVVSLHGIAAELNERQIKTERGGLWHATTVRNVLRRIP